MSEEEKVSTLGAIETAIQMLAGQILNLRTELLVIKASVVKEPKELKESERVAELLYECITGYRYHGPMVHDPVRPEVAKKRILWLVEHYGIGMEDAEMFLGKSRSSS